MTSSDEMVNAVPMVGFVTITRATDIAAGHLTLRGGESIVFPTSSGELYSNLIAWASERHEPAIKEFWEKALRGESTTLSPLEVCVGEEVHILGIGSGAVAKGEVHMSFMDLSKWIFSARHEKATNKITLASLRLASQLRLSVTSNVHWQNILNEFLDLAGLKFGFVGQRKTEADGTPFLLTKAITNIAWDDETHELYRKSAANGFKFSNMDALFGPTIVRGEVLISADYSKEDRGVGLPKGHPPLYTYIGIPLFTVGGSLVGMIGLAGRAINDLDQVVSLCQSLASHMMQLDEVTSLFELDSTYSLSKPVDEELTHTLEVFNQFNLPAIAIKQHVIEWATIAAGRILGVDPIMLHDLDLTDASLGSVGGLREIDYSESSVQSRTMISAESFALDTDRWISTSNGLNREVFQLRKVRDYGDSVVYQVIDFTQLNNAYREAKNVADKFVDISKLQTRLVNMISHELRTPLSSLQTSVELIEMGQSEEEKQRTGKFMTNIYQMVHQMTSHIEGVLTFGKINMGDEQIFKRSTELCGLLGETSDEFQTNPDRVRIDCECGSIKCMVMTDPTLASIMFRNVVSNALKYSRDKVQIRVFRSESDSVAVEIEDSGVGIPERELPEVTKPFFRATNVGTVPGTGIGLSLSERISRLLGVDMTIQSLPAIGTKVAFCFSKEDSR